MLIDACPHCGGRAAIAGELGAQRVACVRVEGAACVIGPVATSPALAWAAWRGLGGPFRKLAEAAARPRVRDARGRMGTVLREFETYFVVQWDHESWTTHAHERGCEWPKFVEGSGA